MLTKNAQQFKNVLNSHDLIFSESKNDEGYCFFDLKEKLHCGAVVNLKIVFNADDTLVCIYGFAINGINPINENYIYEELNYLNSKYTYITYTLVEDTILTKTFTRFDNNFNSNIILNLILATLQSIDAEYSNLMKIIW